MDQFCEVNGVRLCYRTYGRPDGVPVVLILGLGLQLIYWPEALLNALSDQGFYVVIFDNRDAGRSTRIKQRPPTLWQQLTRNVGTDVYDLQDMAQDTLALMDHLALSRAHLMGMSLGGMIAQTIASDHPSRVLTLTSIFSTTGAPNVGQPSVKTLLQFAKPPARTAQTYVARYIKMARAIGATNYPMTEQELAAYAEQAWVRGNGLSISAGVGRQIAAIFKSGDRTSDLARITAPTLVIHGDKDVMVNPSGGVATANAIRGAEFYILQGLGHSLPNACAEDLARLLLKHFKKA